MSYENRVTTPSDDDSATNGNDDELFVGEMVVVSLAEVVIPAVIRQFLFDSV